MSVRRIICEVAARTPVPELVLRHRARRCLTVLAYHRIGCADEVQGYPFDPDVFSATTDEFARELRYFRRNLDVLSVRDLVAGLQGSGALPARPAVITFDDGYRDNHETALPMLRDANLRACFFLATAHIGARNVPWWDEVACCMKHSRSRRIESPFGGDDPPYCPGRGREQTETRRFLRHLKQVPWPDALRSLQRLREQTGVDPNDHVAQPLFMSWEAAKELVAAGMEVGGHTRTHPVVAQLQGEPDLRHEISGGYNDIVERLGCAPVAFAYPVGGAESMSKRADDEVQRAGFEVSFAYLHAFARASAGLWRVPRLHIEYGGDYRAFRLGMALAPLADVREIRET